MFKLSFQIFAFQPISNQRPNRTHKNQKISKNNRNTPADAPAYVGEDLRDIDTVTKPPSCDGR